MNQTLTVLFIGFRQPDTILMLSKLKQYYTTIIPHFISTDLTFHTHLDTKPDVLLLCHHEEDTQGLSALNTLMDADLHLPIYVAFSEQVSDQEVEQYMNAGASNYFILNNLDRLIHLLQPTVLQPVPASVTPLVPQTISPPIPQDLPSLFFQEAPVPLIAVDTSSSRILDASHQTLLDLGYQREALQLLHLSDIWPDSQSTLTLNPDHIALLQDSDSQFVPVTLSRRAIQTTTGIVNLYTYRKLPHPPVYREGPLPAALFLLPPLPSHIEKLMFCLRYLIHHMDSSLSILDSYRKTTNNNLPPNTLLYRYNQTINTVIDSDLMLIDRLEKIVSEPLVAYTSSELETVVEPLLEFYERQDPSLTIRRHFGPVAPVEMPTGELQDALSEILRNALEAMEATTRTALLKITIRQIDNWATIEITDNGEGMSDPVREQCFLPLFTTRRSRGAGLGLTITAAIVYRYDAKMEIDTAERRGTTVRLSLPTAPTPAEPRAVQQVEEASNLVAADRGNFEEGLPIRSRQ